MSTTDHPIEKTAEQAPKQVYPANANTPEQAKSGGAPPSVWVMTTNFAEGFPYMLVRILSTVYFTDIGVKERYLGYLNFLGIPWNFKFLWSPFIDIFSTRKRWMTIIQALIAMLTMAIALISYTIPMQGEISHYLVFISFIFIGMAFLAATNDIAIDAYYLEGLPDKSVQAAYVGYRMLAFRLSMIFARTGLVAFVDYLVFHIASNNKYPHWVYKMPFLASPDKYRPWAYAFVAGSITMLLLSLFHGFALRNYEAARKGDAKEKLHSYGRAFWVYLSQERAAMVLLFIILYKIGDEIIFSMVTPFLMRELAITKTQYAWVGGIVGAAGTIVGAMLGGYWIKRTGLKRAIWPLTILMNFNIWAYIWLAWAKPDPATQVGISMIAFVHGYEQFAAGLGSAALTVFMMRLCHAEFKAAHYAIGSAIMSIPSTLIGGFSGRLVEQMGYFNLFVLGFFATIPSMIMLYWLPIKDEADNTVTTTK
jgi:MFS transporter, PAT family, beta-lactamase induction signal transducer AmpG